MQFLINVKHLKKDMERNSQKVLIVSFFFNQTERIGSVRLRGLAKYLPEFGWDPVILTANESAHPINQSNIYETSFEDTIGQREKKISLPSNTTLNEQGNIPTRKTNNGIIYSLLRFLHEIITYPDITINWSTTAIKKGNEILRENHIDAIISSSSPITSHIIAYELKKNFKIPWIADFRDLWTQNHYYRYSGIRKFFEKRLEHKILSSVTALSTVSEPLAEKLSELNVTQKVFSIPNGFDPEQVNPGTSVTKKFSITYTGTLYEGQRDPDPLFKMLKTLFEEKKIDPTKIEVNFFGNRENWLIQDVKRYQLENLVHIHGPISREESIQRQRESQILLLLTWNNPVEKGVYTGKLFDYLAARRPILSMGYAEGGVVKELLEQTHAGVHVSNEVELAEYLMNAYNEYKETGTVHYHGIEMEVMKYSHREMARKFSEVLDSVVKMNYFE